MILVVLNSGSADGFEESYLADVNLKPRNKEVTPADLPYVGHGAPAGELIDNSLLKELEQSGWFRTPEH